MKISVIIPVYNSESTIERLLDCLHEQKFKEFETLLIDDGSTDSSFRVCNEYSKSLGLGIRLPNQFSIFRFSDQA